MVILFNQDFLEVKTASLLADYDRDTLINLYQPLVGYEAIAVYFTLWSEANNQKITSLSTHGQLIRRMHITHSDFIEGRKRLEGVGLLKTYITVDNDTKLYTYELYAPKTPKAFFDDALLFGLLIKLLGETEAYKFKNIYKLEKSEEQGTDISASFVEVFSPNFNDPAFIKALEGSSSIDRNSGYINSEFSYEAFFTEVKRLSQIKEEAFTKKDMKEIERLATLNGVTEKNAARAVVYIFDAYAGKGKHIDFAKLTKMFQEDSGMRFAKGDVSEEDNKPNLNSSNTDIGQKVILMEKVSPRRFLSILQNGTEPAPADLRLVDDISKKYKLPNSVINALIDYTLSMNNNILSRTYCEKVAASLARQGVKTTLDAMNYLRKAGKTTKGRKNTTDDEKGVKEVEETMKVENRKDESISWDEILDDPDDGDPNGKA